MIVPPYLQPGNKIAVIAPARFMDLNQIKEFEKWANNHHWEVLVSPNLGKRFHQFGGTESQRLDDINWALENPDIKAVFSARGGYGTLRILKELKMLDFTAQPKWWVGFSDITVLHAVLSQQGIASIHGPMVMQFDQHNQFLEVNQNSLALSLTGKAQFLCILPNSRCFNPEEIAADIQIPVANIQPPAADIQTPAADIQPPAADNQTLVANNQTPAADIQPPFEGILWGGNLSLIYGLAAAKQLPDLTNKVLFIEDVDEYLYHIDRMLRALEIAGIFKGIAGLIVGSMTDMKDHQIPFGWNVTQIIHEVLKDYTFPIVFGLESGHDQKNFSLKLGMSIKFDGKTISQF